MPNNSSGIQPPSGHGPAPWPTAVGRVTSAGLSTALLKMAALHARRAVSLVGSNDALELIDQAVSIGASVELLVKSTLAGIDVHLIRTTTGNSHDTTMALIGKPKTIGRLPVLKTIGGKDGIVLLNRCQTELGVGGSTIRSEEKLFAVRDSAVHLGLVDRDENDEAVTLLVKVTKSLLELRNRLGQPSDWPQYWADQLEPANEIENRAAEALSTRYEQQLASARRSFQLRWPNPGRDKNLIQLLEQTKPRHERDQVTHPVTCPACSNQGWVTYDVERSDPQIDDSDAPHSVAWFVKLTGRRRDFDCQVCQLFLDDPDELDQAGIEDADLGEAEATPDEVEAWNDGDWSEPAFPDDYR